MKKLLIAFAIPALFLSACNGGGEEEGTDGQVEIPESLKGMMTLNLSEQGLPFSLMIPDTTKNKLEVVAQPYGDTEVRVGDYFQVQIAVGGDIALRKSDLNEDLLYKATILQEDGTSIFYKQEIEGSNLDPEYHFYLVKNVNGADYEIQDIKSGETYSEKAALKMFDSAKNIIQAKQQPA